MKRQVNVIAGALVLLLAVAMLAMPVVAADDYVFVKKWGSEGSGDGEFYMPSGVAVNATGIVYVADTGNSRIQMFDSDGHFLGKWGSEGSGDGEFSSPFGVAVNATGTVYVADTGNNRIQMFDSGGTFLGKWGSGGSGDGEFANPFGVAVDASGTVYVANYGNHRVQRFDSGGTFLGTWGSYGSGDGEFSSPFGVAVNASGTVYVTDRGNNRIQMFDSGGTFLGKWGSGGSGDGELSSPFGVEVDASGIVYVADEQNSRIQRFDSSGTFLGTWGSYGTGNGQFSDPFDIAVNAAGTVYVVEWGNNRIQMFALVPAPTVTGIDPDAGLNTGSVSITDLSGTGFVDGTTVKLNRTGETDIQATDVSVVSSTQITCTLDLTGAAAGTWNVVVTKPGDQSAVLEDGFTVIEGNQPPEVTAIVGPIDPLAVDASVSVSGTFSDPDAGDIHTAVWDWGDGTTGAGTVDEVAGSVTGSHAYTEAGIYTIALTVTDSSDESDTATAETYVVIYDPDGGFVTGGGWITSPEGAYAPDPSLTGKATFGFVSRYTKGASAPTGNTEFQFKTADLNFHSTAYDWLVVAGARAQFKGTGTINGDGEYGFMLTAIDGAINGGGGTDKFRIKIWDRSDDTIVYDNQMDDEDDAAPTTVIGGGSIVIHKK